MEKGTRYLTQAALIAAIYVVFTLPFATFGTNYIQVRVAEALAILPFFTPAAIPGLTIGCLLSNAFISPYGMIDIVFGTLATLIASYWSFRIKNKYLVPIPPIVVNAIIVGALIYYGKFDVLEFNGIILSYMGGVALGQTIACYGLGMPLLSALERYKTKIFE
ncbi:MAG: QueT transporter family protein [Eubacteriales bacterium]